MILRSVRIFSGRLRPTSNDDDENDVPLPHFSLAVYEFPRLVYNCLEERKAKISTSCQIENIAIRYIVSDGIKKEWHIEFVML
jgi:hypothetical protein